MNFDTTGLLDPQKPHAIKLCDSIFFNGVAWDGSETGCGKMYVGCAIARHFEGPIVIVAPKLILRKWKEILATFGVQDSPERPVIFINYEKLCRGNTKWLKYRKVARPATNVVNREKVKYNKYGKPVKKGLFRPDENIARYFNAVIYFPAGSLVILDESHRCKGINSLQSGFLMSLKRQGYKVLMASATQACSPLDMRAFGYSVNLIPNPEMKTFKNFCLEAGAVETGHFGAMTFNDESDEAKQKMLKIHEHLFDFSKIGSRLTRRDMGDLFPEHEIIVDAYDMGTNSDKIQHAFDVMEAEIAKMDAQTAGYSNHVFAEIMKARRRIEMLKVPTFVDMIEDLYDEGKSVIIYVNFTETIEAIGARLERMRKFRGRNTIGYLYGERTLRQREQDIEDFQADRKRIMIVNIACAESIGLHDLLGNHPRAQLLNPSFSAMKVLQAKGRGHRQGGLTKVYTRFIFADRTYENRICNRLSGRLDNLEMMNNGDLTGGINWFRLAEGHNI